MLSYGSSNTRANLAHLDFIHKKLLSYFDFSHQTQHPLFILTRGGRRPEKLVKETSAAWWE